MATPIPTGRVGVADERLILFFRTEGSGKSEMSWWPRGSEQERSVQFSLPAEAKIGAPELLVLDAGGLTPPRVLGADFCERLGVSDHEMLLPPDRQDEERALVGAGFLAFPPQAIVDLDENARTFRYGLAVFPLDGGTPTYFSTERIKVERNAESEAYVMDYVLDGSDLYFTTGGSRVWKLRIEREEEAVQ